MVVYSLVGDANGGPSFRCDICCIDTHICREWINASVDISSEASGVGGALVEKVDESIRWICPSEEAERFEETGPTVVILC